MAYSKALPRKYVGLYGVVPDVYTHVIIAKNALNTGIGAFCHIVVLLCDLTEF